MGCSTTPFVGVAGGVGAGVTGAYVMNLGVGGGESAGTESASNGRLILVSDGCSSSVTGEGREGRGVHEALWEG